MWQSRNTKAVDLVNNLVHINATFTPVAAVLRHWTNLCKKTFSNNNSGKNEIFARPSTLNNVTNLDFINHDGFGTGS